MRKELEIVSQKDTQFPRRVLSLQLPVHSHPLRHCHYSPPTVAHSHWWWRQPLPPPAPQSNRPHHRLRRNQQNSARWVRFRSSSPYLLLLDLWASPTPVAARIGSVKEQRVNRNLKK